MRSLRLRSIFLSLLAAILVIIIAGCGGMSNSSPSNPASPPGGNSGGNGGGTGGGSPQASTFVYFNNGFPGTSGSILVYKLAADGTLTSTSSSPMTDPIIVEGQSGKFLVGIAAGANAGPAVYNVNTQTGVAQSQVSHVHDGGGVTDGTTLYVSSIFPNGTNGAGGGIDAYSISSSGQLSLVPGSPFDQSPSDTFFSKSYGSLQIVGSFLFGDFNTVKNAGNITVFSRAASGALARQFEFGNGNSPFGFVIHPNARFAYVLSDVVNLDVYSLDLGANPGGSRIQQISVHDLNAGLLQEHPTGKYLFIFDKGLREFTIDQSSGKLTEIQVGALASDNGVRTFKIDPSGHFLIVAHADSVNVFSINASTGALTQVGPSYAVGSDLRFITFATF